MATIKKSPDIESPAPALSATIGTPVYDPNNLGDVLKRLSSLADDVKKVSGDLAAHYTKHTRHHYTNGALAQVSLDAPVDFNPATAAQLHQLQSAIGEFVHAVGRTS
jgi:hypothetical protein